MSIDVVSPFRQRMIEDMIARKLGPGTQEPTSTMLLKDKPRSLQRER